MECSLPPTLIQHRRDFIKMNLKNMAIILLCVFAFAVPIYFLADWHTLIKWVALGMLSSLIPLCIYLTRQSRQIIHQDAQGITIKIGLWRIKTVRIDYQDIIAVTDIYLPAKRYKNPPYQICPKPLILGIIW